MTEIINDIIPRMQAAKEKFERIESRLSNLSRQIQVLQDKERTLRDDLSEASVELGALKNELYEAL